jgi:hypothetical protein
MTKGKVRSVTAFRVTNSIIGSGEGTSERDKAYFYEFDEDGNRIHELSFADGEEEQEVQRVYTNGHVVNEKIIFITDEVSEEVVYDYDDKGLIRSCTRTYSDGSTEKTEFTYDGDHLIRKVLLDDDGEAETEDVFKYENGRVTEHIQKEYGEEKKRSVRKYNEKGQEIEEIRSDDEGTVLKVIFEPKENDRMPDAKVYNADGKIIEAIMYRYDESGRLLQELVETTTKGFRRLDTRYTYDDNGRLILEETLDQNGVLRKRVNRVYDDHDMVVREHQHEENPDYGSYMDLTTEYEYTFY